MLVNSLQSFVRSKTMSCGVLIKWSWSGKLVLCSQIVNRMHLSKNIMFAQKITHFLQSYKIQFIRQFLLTKMVVSDKLYFWTAMSTEQMQQK